MPRSTATATIDAAIDGDGARIATRTSSGGFGWTLARPARQRGRADRRSRYRRYQGRLLLSTPANNDLYDFGARSYARDLGVFTQLDSYSGSALNPISLNRFLYANANPATLIDPDGHAASVPYVLHLHRLLFGHTDGGGGRLKTEQNLIVSYTRGHREVLFTPPSPKETEFLLPELFERYRQAAVDQAAHPVLLIGALVLDFLAIHPVADGNGRLARLITTHALLDQGYSVSRYVSVEQRMFATKDAYYDALYASQRRWHDGEHNVWPWVGYLVDILAAAYDDFEGRVAARRNLAAGSKQDQVRRYILQHAPDVFRIRDVRAALPGIGDPTIKRVLADLRHEGRIEAADDRAAGRLSAWKRRPAVVPVIARFPAEA